MQRFLDIFSLFPFPSKMGFRTTEWPPCFVICVAILAFFEAHFLLRSICCLFYPRSIAYLSHEMLTSFPGCVEIASSCCLFALKRGCLVSRSGLYYGDSQSVVEKNRRAGVI